MLENREKFYLYDRWYYLQKDLDNKLTYVSNPDNCEDGMILTYDKNSNEVDIIQLSDGEFIAKLVISDITNNKITYHYKENTPQDIYIDDELYVNLLLEANIETNYGRIDKESLIRISRKKNMDKILYDVPNIPLDEDIYMDKFKIKSKTLDYFLGLIDSFSIYISKIKKYVNEEVEHKEVIEKKATNLSIPSELRFYDRKYEFKGKTDSVIIFTNNQDSEDNLMINIDPNFDTINGLTLESITKSNIKYVLKADLDNQNRVRVIFSNDRKAKIKITQKEVIETLYMYEATYTDGKKESSTITLEKNNTITKLTPHPIFTNQYVDYSGNEYCFSNQDFSRLSGISDFMPNILNGINYQLTKSK